MLTIINLNKDIIVYNNYQEAKYLWSNEVYNYIEYKIYNHTSDFEVYITSHEHLFNVTIKEKFNQRGPGYGFQLQQVSNTYDIIAIIEFLLLILKLYPYKSVYVDNNVTTIGKYIMC
jgi:hypothetical protein